MSPWGIPSLLALVLLTGLLAYVSRRRPPAPLWPVLGFVVGGALLFTVGDILSSHFAQDALTQWTALILLYGGLWTIGPANFFMALLFGRAQGVTLRLARSRLRFAIPAAYAVLAVGAITNPWHGHFVTLSVRGQTVYHSLWWASAALGYLTIWLSIGVYLAVAWRADHRRIRADALTMAAALGLAWLGSAIYVGSGLTLPLDTTAVGLSLGCCLFFLGIYRHGLFGLSSVALSRALEQESDPLLLLDLGGRMLYANPAARLRFGASSLALGNAPLPELARRLQELEEPGGAAGAADLLVEDLDACDGRLYRLGEESLRLRIAPVHASRGDRIGCWLRFRDETALDHATRKLREQKAVREAILASSEAGILVTDPAGRVRYVNRRFAEIGGFDDAHLEDGGGRSLLEASVRPTEDPGAFLKWLDELTREPSAAGRDEIRLEDGRVLERSTAPLMLSGEPAGRVWFVRDLTEQRETEETLRRSQRLDSLGLLAGGIAHDFNNLLVSMLGNADHALDGLDEGHPVREPLADIVRAAERASDLTQKMLAYAGKGGFAVEDVDLSRLVGETRDLLAVSLSPGVEIELDLAGDLPGVRADPAQLQQVVMNLLLNAADAIGDGTGRVRVETRLAGPDAEPGAGPAVLLCVSDDGCGMDPFTQEKIFEPFFSTKFSGRGLGLAAVDGIVRRLEGAIEVESAPGKGSRFRVRLPCGTAPAEARADGRGAGERPTAARVLVVDDESQVRQVASRMLAEAGFETLDAESGERALELFRSHRHRIDVVFLDVTMPGLSGVETLAELRRLDPGVPVVWTSGYPEAELEIADAAGSPPFVQKPYRAAALREVIQGALASRPPAAG